MPDELNFDALLNKLRATKDAEVLGATEEEIAAANARLPNAIPLRWQEVLRVHNGGEIRPRPYVQFHLWPAAQIEMMSPHRLGVGEEPGWGNWLTLAIAEQTADGDCPVRWFNGEGAEQEATWETIAAFLHWWLEETA